MLDNITELISSAVLLTVTSSTPSLTLDNIYSKEVVHKADKNQKLIYTDDYCYTEFNNSVVNYFKDKTYYKDSIIDAFRRYKLLNGKDYKLPKQTSSFFHILYNVIPFAKPILYFDDDSLTADFMVNDIKYTLKNDFDLPNRVFLAHFKKVDNKKRLNIAEYDISDLVSIRDAINE